MTRKSGSNPIFTTHPDATASYAAERQLQELADREEIRDLIATYAHRVAHGLANADLFTDDGAYIHRRPGHLEPEIVRGRAALDAHYIERPGSAGVATPMIHNSLLSIDGDEARGICSLELRIWGDTPIMASGYYEDRMRRENGHWKFVEGDCTFFHWNTQNPV